MFTRPAGYVSVKDAPAIAAVLLLESVIVSTAVEPGAMELGAKAFAIVGRAETVSVAVGPAVVPAFVVVTVPVVLAYVPPAALVTLTVTVHEPFAGTVPPESTRLVPPLAAVTVPPTQLVAGEADAVFTIPAGYVSVKAAPVTAVPLPLLSVIVSTDVLPVPIAAGVNDLLAPSEPNTESEELAAVVLEPALVLVTAPIGSVFA